MDTLFSLTTVVMGLALLAIGMGVGVLLTRRPKVVDLPTNTTRPKRRRRRPRPAEILARLKGENPHAEGRYKNPVPCLLCGEAMGHVGNYGDDSPFVSNHPVGGLAFETQGHYGSSFFDPGYSGIKLEAAAHDECLRKVKSRLRVVTYKTQPTVYQVRAGDPEL